MQEVYKVASKNNAYTQFWSQYSSVRSTHSLPAKDVDGSLVTGASQDHFVVFHHLKTFTFTENFATILAGSTSPPSDIHRLTVCSALKNGHLLCRIEHFHFLDGILTSLCIFYWLLYTVLSLSWTVCTQAFSDQRGGQSGTLNVFLKSVTYRPTLSKFREG